MQADVSAIHAFLRPSICNGNPNEQAQIRRWWHEEHSAKGRLIWEYPLFDCWLDAIWIPDAPCYGVEESGLKLPSRFPLRGQRIVVCEAKHRRVSASLIGQALVYGAFARRAGAIVDRTVVFAERVTPELAEIASELGLHVVAQSSAGRLQHHTTC